MNQLTIDFIHTRARRTDGDTSREAAKHAASRLADIRRLAIKECVAEAPTGLTAKEVARITYIDYIEVQRRISETGLVKTDQRRDGCAVWKAC